MADNIYMNVAEVKKMAGQFGEMSDNLKKYSKTLEAMIQMLKASAFVGLFGNAAYATYLEQLKPVIDNYADKSDEMKDDLIKSAEAYERGDAQGAARFH